MNLVKLNSFPAPFQNPPEWRQFIEFSELYLRNRGVDHPVVVEIGIYQNLQRPFYQEFLNAEHIGVDIESVNSTPDIMGNSTDPNTALALQERLAGRQIDLLFIDGGHDYGTVKSDYEVYGSMTKHIVVFHDIYTREVEVRKLWGEIIAGTDKTTMEIRAPQSYMGIGMVLK
jgi:hypothetical protein